MRVKDEAYLRKIRQTPCLVCQRWSQAHHLMHAEPSATGKRSGDNWAVPLCSYHHEALHRFGDEASWWAVHGIDPIEWAKESYDDYKSK
jgi:hypothetical protein